MLDLIIRLTNKTALTATACLWFFGFSSVISYAKEWRGITPAQSTRGDVVRLLGQCSDPKARCSFSSDEGEVFIVFTGEFGDYFKCNAQLPADTVLQIQVAPKTELKLSDLTGNGNNFKELAPPDDVSFGYQVYLDEEAGLVVRVSRGMAELVSYIAAAKDRQACANYYGMVESASYYFPLCRLPLPIPELIEIREPRAFSEVGSISEGDVRAGLDKFAAKLRDEPGAQAYVIAYAGRKSRAGEARARAERARAYLMSKHGMEEGRIVVVDGGYREAAAVELFTVPAGATPPTPTPTLDPKDITVTPDRKSKKPTR
ncbi:MAG TPA: hypothetical protein VF538_08835 [Pyrinomonadaceae bacterium]|jgi:hypothetical protein